MITIERLGHLGDGIAGDLRIPRVLPGEVVELIDGQARIVTPSAQRVAAPCRHYKTCGGCALQHASDALVAEFKQSIVQRALAARGIEAPIRGIVTSPARSRRRAALSGRRLKSGAVVGFHARGSDTVIATLDCHLLTPAITAALPALAELTESACSRKGEMTLHVTDTETGLDVLATGGRALDLDLRVTLARIAQGWARLTYGDETLVQAEAPRLMMGRAPVSPPPGAFLQATAQGEAALVTAMREAVGDAKRIADLFAGCGTFALPLAETAEVHAVEGSRPLLTALDAGWRAAQGLHKVTTQARDLFRNPLLPDELGRFDAVVIDPPRAGAESQTLEIARAQVPVIGAVSCNPVTFARDAETLIRAGYRLDWVQVVDQFRWSAHVELAARFSLPHIPHS